MKKVIIIAEIGINHNGNMNIAHELIRQAAMCGADVAKFQLYSVDGLFGPDGHDPRPDLCDKLQHVGLSKDNVVQLMKWCDEQEIEFMASVFDEERLQWLEDLGVRRHKIASRTMKLTPDLAEKIVKTGKECFVSTGMGGGFNGKYRDRTRSLYCVSEYPTEFTSLEMPEKFSGMASKLDSMPYYDGFSDHTLGIGASLVALGRGAEVIEKHFTLNKAAEGFDHICSITPDELSDLVKYAREIEKVVRFSR